jgi:regulator of sigma E protease
MSVVYFLLLVGVLVAVHELGHFSAARALGIRVLRLSLGFGPTLAKVSLGGTEYRIGAVPLGGYVRLLGEDPWDEIPEHERHLAFCARPIWQRLIVVFAGPAANLVMPLFIYFFFFLGHTEVPAATVGDVLNGSPAEMAGLRPGDRVLSVDGKGVRTWEAFEAYIDGHAEQAVRVTFARAGEEQSTYVTPRRFVMRRRSGTARAQGLIGVTQAPLPPRVGILDPGSPAARAGLKTGDLIISVDGEPVDSWTVLADRLRRHTRRIPLAILRPTRAPLGFADVRVHDAEFADVVPDFHVADDGRSSIETGLASAEFFVAQVEPGSPAANAGLAAGDLIASLDGDPITSWLRFDQALQAEPDRDHQLSWRRAAPGGGATLHSATLRQEHRLVRDEYGHDEAQLVFGAQNDFRPGNGQMVPIDGRVLYAAGHAWSRTGRTITEVAGGFVSLLAGEVPRDGVGGPIMMYRIASVSGQKGWDYFLLMIALISVNLGLINLLPIPVLDGGHLVMFALEGAARRAVAPRVREAALLVGLVVLVSMTLLALRNDVLRYVLQ